MGNDECVLCGKPFGYNEYCAYFERGISKKLIICKLCHDHKVNLRDFNVSETIYNTSKTYMEARVAGKVAEIRNVVDAWIDGESFNYFPVPEDLVYYVEGPDAHLFVFEDRFLILSSTCKLEGTEVLLEDVQVLYCNEEGTGDVVFFRRNMLSDIDRLNYIDASDRKYPCFDDWKKIEKGGINYGKDAFKYRLQGDNRVLGQKSVNLDVSFGEYGMMSFGYICGMASNTVKFRFFYHQNQLMEEVYNYIRRRQALVGKEDKQVEMAPVQKVTASAARRMQAKESAEGKNNTGSSLADEITKLKGLLDCGILTQEEFDRAKNKLIDMM